MLTRRLLSARDHPVIRASEDPSPYTRSWTIGGKYQGLCTDAVNPNGGVVWKPMGPVGSLSVFWQITQGFPLTTIMTNVDDTKGTGLPIGVNAIADFNSASATIGNFVVLGAAIQRNDGTYYNWYNEFADPKNVGIYSRLYSGYVTARLSAISTTNALIAGTVTQARVGEFKLDADTYVSPAMLTQNACPTKDYVSTQPISDGVMTISGADWSKRFEGLLPGNASLYKNYDEVVTCNYPVQVLTSSAAPITQQFSTLFFSPWISNTSSSGTYGTTWRTRAIEPWDKPVLNVDFQVCAYNFISTASYNLSQMHFTYVDFFAVPDDGIATGYNVIPVVTHKNANMNVAQVSLTNAATAVSAATAIIIPIVLESHDLSQSVRQVNATANITCDYAVWLGTAITVSPVLLTAALTIVPALTRVNSVTITHKDIEGPSHVTWWQMQGTSVPVEIEGRMDTEVVLLPELKPYADVSNVDRMMDINDNVAAAHDFNITGDAKTSFNLKIYDTGVSAGSKRGRMD